MIKMATKRKQFAKKKGKKKKKERKNAFKADGQRGMCLPLLQERTFIHI